MKYLWLHHKLRAEREKKKLGRKGRGEERGGGGSGEGGKGKEGMKKYMKIQKKNKF
jgi:hypothetical protein